MEEDVIQLKKSDDILRLRIRDEKGRDTGEYLEFDLEDINLPNKYKTIIEEDEKARNELMKKIKEIDEMEDTKSEDFITEKEEAQIKAMQEFYQKEIEIYNMFLGENGVQKLLNGRSIGWGTLKEIDQIINEVILPKLSKNAENIKKKIMKKYSIEQKASGVIE